jgi:tRNA threonylcarbamoyladenosine biosynthesis protein TsaE
MPVTLSLVSQATEATEHIGQIFASFLKSGDIVSLDGDMGAGKTALTRGIARGLGLTSPVASPTFTIVMEHPAELIGQLPLYHFDVYRLRNGDDFLDAGLDEYLYQDGVSVLEWGDIVKDVLPEHILRISMSGSDETRKLDFVFPLSRREDLSQLAVRLSGDTQITISPDLIDDSSVDTGGSTC